MSRPPPKAATPMAFVQAIVSAYARYQRDPGAALQAAAIEPEHWQRGDGFVTSLQFERLADFAMRELDDEALGWFERRLPWGSYGLLARASISAPRLGLALQRWCRHHALLADAVHLHLEAGPGPARLWLQERADLGPRREFCHVSLLRNALGFASWLIDSRLALQAAAFAYPAPAHSPSYTLLFGAPLRFAAARTEMVFDSAYLALPLRRDESALRQMLRHALPLLVRPYRHDRLLLERVRLLLQQQPTASAAQLAQACQMSLRSLQRQLAPSGHSVQALRDEVRLQRAQALLWRSALPLKQVALQAGYADPKSLGRAFRQHLGCTPSAWRQQGAQASVAPHAAAPLKPQEPAQPR